MVPDHLLDLSFGGHCQSGNRHNVPVDDARFSTTNTDESHLDTWASNIGRTIHVVDTYNPKTTQRPVHTKKETPHIRLALCKSQSTGWLLFWIHHFSNLKHEDKKEREDALQTQLQSEKIWQPYEESKRTGSIKAQLRSDEKIMLHIPKLRGQWSNSIRHRQLSNIDRQLLLSMHHQRFERLWRQTCKGECKS